MCIPWNIFSLKDDGGPAISDNMEDKLCMTCQLTDSRTGAARGWGVVQMGSCYSMGIKVQLEKMKTLQRSSVPVVNNIVLCT